MYRRNWLGTSLMVAGASLVLTLAACGGGGGGNSQITGPTYTGVTTAATIDSTNAEPIGKAAGGAAGQAAGSESASSASFLGVVSDDFSDIPPESFSKLAAQIARQTLEESQTAPSTQSNQTSVSGVVVSSDQLNADTMSSDYCGGSVTVPNNFTVNGSNFDVTMTFNNLCYDNGIDPGVYLNGTMRMISTDSSDTIIFSGFTATMFSGETYSLNLTSSCDSGGFSCTVDFNGGDGNVYRMGNLNVYEGVSGVTISGTFYHPDSGSVTLSTTTPLTFNCAPDSQPDTGELAFSGEAGTSARIVFQSCTDYTFCYNEGMGELCDVGTW